MNGGPLQPTPLKVNWEALALWFGRLLFLVALYYGRNLVHEVEALHAAQETQNLALHETQQSLSNIAREMQLRTESRWTRIDQKIWATLLAQENPKIKVPDPTHEELPGEAQR